MPANVVLAMSVAHVTAMLFPGIILPSNAVQFVEMALLDSMNNVMMAIQLQEMDVLHLVQYKYSTPA